MHTLLALNNRNNMVNWKNVIWVGLRLEFKIKAMSSDIHQITATQLHTFAIVMLTFDMV